MIYLFYLLMNNKSSYFIRKSIACFFTFQQFGQSIDIHYKGILILIHGD